MRVPEPFGNWFSYFNVITSKFKTIIFIMAKAIEITDSNFSELIATDQPVLVDFWAEWCGPCKMIGPIVEELAGEFAGKAVICKVDVDSNPNLSVEYGVRNIPTLLVFKGGKVVEKQVGVTSKSNLAKLINNHI